MIPVNQHYATTTWICSSVLDHLVFCPCSPLCLSTFLLFIVLMAFLLLLDCILYISSVLIFSRCRHWSKQILLFSAVCLCKTSVSVRASPKQGFPGAAVVLLWLRAFKLHIIEKERELLWAFIAKPVKC